MTNEWNILGLKEQIGPIPDVGLKIFLLRYEGVNRLPEFPQPPQKGKACAA
jgi:hypothetical protein